MSVIIRLQNLPWAANALDIRTFFRGLSIPEGGVHIVGGELGDAFIAFSTDEDARQAMMLDGGKVKEIQVKLFLSSRSEMHKVIETARQPAPAPAPAPAPPPAPAVVPAPAPAPVFTPFSAALGGNPLGGLGIPGIGNPQEIPQPAVIEPPAPLSLSPPIIVTPQEPEKDEDDRAENKRNRDRNRRRSRSRSGSRSRSRDKERKDRKRRDRSRSRDRRRRDRSRSRDRRDRKRDRRSRSRDRSDSRRRLDERRASPAQDFRRQVGTAAVPTPVAVAPAPAAPPPPVFNNQRPGFPGQVTGDGPPRPNGEPEPNRFDRQMTDAYNRLHELGKKRDPNAFQGDQNGGPKFTNGTEGRAGRQRNRFEPERDSCVAVRNAPNHTSYGDVRRFFPFMIDKHGIKMINDPLGRRTGNIFVRFCEPRSKHLALQRRPNELKGQPVTVEHLDDDDYEAAVDSFLPYREDPPHPHRAPHAAAPSPAAPAAAASPAAAVEPYTVLRLTDMPNFIKEHDIIKAFSDFSLLSIALSDCRATRTRSALVQFVKAEDAAAAYERRDRYVFGRRRPAIAPVPRDQYEAEKTSRDPQAPRVASPSPAAPPSPAAASPPVAPAPAPPRDPRQRRQDPAAAAAPAFAQQPMFAQPGGFPQPFVPPQFGGFPAGPAGPAGWPDPRAPFVPRRADGPDAAAAEFDEEPLDCVLMKGLPREATDRTIVEFLAETGAVPARIHLMLDARGAPSGDCFCEFRSAGEARRAARRHCALLEGRRVSVDLVPRALVADALDAAVVPAPHPAAAAPAPAPALLGDAPGQPFYEHPRGGFSPRGQYRGRGGGGFARGGYERGGFERGRFNGRGRGGFDRGRGFDRGGARGGHEGRGRGRGFGRGRGGFDGERGFDEPRFDGGGAAGGAGADETDPALEDFGAPGCVVTMENVPFRANVDDILQFFSEFQLTQDDVIRRFNERGQPTGDARVAFRTPFDAQRACKTHHLDTIHDRRISLNIL